MDIIKQIEEAQMKQDVPEFRPGDTVRIEVKVVEGNRERLQAYEGVVIKRVGKGLTESFTVPLMVLPVKESSQFIPHALRASRLFAKGKCVVQNFIICAIVTAKLLVSKKSIANRKTDVSNGTSVFYLIQNVLAGIANNENNKE